MKPSNLTLLVLCIVLFSCAKNSKSEKILYYKAIEFNLDKDGNFIMDDGTSIENNRGSR